MSEYRPDETLDREEYDKEYVKHVKARMKRAQLRREEQVKKNRKLIAIVGAIVVVLITVIIFANSCSNGKGKSEAESTTPEVTTTSEIPSEEETTLVSMFTMDVLNLRAKPNTKSRIIVQIGAGKKVEVLSDEGKWCKVKRGKDEGYVMKKYLSYTNTLY